MEIALNDYDREYIQYYGRRRYESSRERGQVHKHGAEFAGDESASILVDTIGVGCELVVAKYLQVYMPFSLEPDDGADLWVGGSGIGVRGTGDGHNRRLFLHKEDKDIPFVWVTTTKNEYLDSYWIRGWLFADEGKRDEWWCDPTRDNRWAYFVPLDELRLIEELKGSLWAH